MAYDKARDYLSYNPAKDTMPARRAWTITAAAEDQTVYPRALWLNAAGDVTGIPIDAAADTAVTFTAVPAGWFEMGFRRISNCPANTLGVR